MFVPEGKRFKPRKFLKLAEKLIKDEKYEKPARIRTAVGRAYYASHLFVKERMQQAGWSIPDDHSVHEYIIEELLDTEIAHIGSKLDHLFEKRRDADYYMDVPLESVEGNYCIQLSQEIIAFMEQFPLRKKT
jgi:uncharacterized protein (UPF0332 family)